MTLSTDQPVDTFLPLPRAALQASLAVLLPVLLDVEGDLLAVKDSLSGRYVHVNDTMAAFLGRPGAEVLGSSDSDWFEASVATAFRAAEHTALAQSAPLSSEHRFEWRGARRD